MLGRGSRSLRGHGMSGFSGQVPLAVTLTDSRGGRNPVEGTSKVE